MKKILALLGTCSLTTTGITTIVSCLPKSGTIDYGPDDNGIGKNDDMSLKIMNETHKKVLKYANENAILDTNDYQLPELNQLFNLVNSNNQEVELQLETPFGAKINNFFENNFKPIFDSVNRQIANEYSNYYVDLMPFTFKPSSSILKVNYVDVTALQKLTSEPIKNLKAVVVNYSFVGSIKAFKTLTNPTRFNIKYVITKDRDMIGKFLVDSLNKFRRVLTGFLLQNPQINIDENPAFKQTYDMFNVYYAKDATLINKDMLVLLDNVFKSNNTTSKLMEVVSYVNHRDILELQQGTINNDNRLNYNYPFSEMKNQTPAAWAGEGQNPAGLTAENFVKFYRSKMTIFQDSSKDLALGTFRINFNKIVVAGMPLGALASFYPDEFDKLLIVRIGISQNGLNKKLINFGNLIVAFIKYYNAILRRGGWNTFYISQSLLNKVINEYGRGTKDIQLNPLYSIILENFKQSKVAKTLPDLNLLSLQNFRWYAVKAVFLGNQFQIGWDSFWSLGFNFGNSFQASIAYTAWVYVHQLLKFVV